MTMAQHICGECGHQFCPECVVFPFGAAKPPYCITCALEVGGVRRHATNRPKLTRKSIRRRLAMQRQIRTPEPVVDQPPVDPSDQRWLDTAVGPQDVPGAWQQRFPAE